MVDQTCLKGEGGNWEEECADIAYWHIVNASLGTWLDVSQSIAFLEVASV